MFEASVAVPPAPVRVPSQRPLATSVTSITSVANDKGDNEMISWAVHRSPGICLTAEENPGKPQLGDSLMKGMCDIRYIQLQCVNQKIITIIKTRIMNKTRNNLHTNIAVFICLVLLLEGKGQD